MKKFSYTDSGVKIDIEGLFLYKDECGMSATQTFLKDFLEKKISFDDLCGSYLVKISYPDNKEVFFSDNSGMRRYFINYSDTRFEKSFSAALPQERIPNYKAIAQFLYFGCVYNCDTIEKSVKLSNPNSYYVVSKGVIEEKDKGLLPFEEYEHDENVLAKVMQNVSNAIADYKNIFCTITGGCDSRSILAHLLHNGVKPRLDITGQSGHIDVLIAKEIASKIKADLMLVEDNPEEGWIDEAISAASMGMSGVIVTYRLYKKAKILGKIDDTIELGGMAGELYKNSFINHEFPFYSGYPNWGKFIKYKVLCFDFPMHLCGSAIKDNISNMRIELKNLFEGYELDSKANSYLNAGYMILQQRSACLSTMNNNHYVQYNPLIERKVAAYSFNKSPYELEMQLFQRKQVSDYWSDIMDVKTDRGLTCNKNKCVSEFVNSMLYLFKFWLKRFISKNNSEQTSECMELALKSEQYHRAFKRCQDLKIISGEIKEHDVQPAIADRIFLVGSIL